MGVQPPNPPSIRTLLEAEAESVPCMYIRDVNEARGSEAEAWTLEAKAWTLEAKAWTLKAEARTLEAKA